MHVNKTIIIGTIIIIVGGVYTTAANAAKGSKGQDTLVTRVLIGGYLVAIVLSIADLFAPLQALASAFLMLAVTTTLFAVLPDLAQRIQKRSAAHA